ncbi:hypothetical protein ThidrDRAFT_1127 [Thiorhodococcus drewsii AZ1]|uniref:Uncharacterized protein n=1 Tax=Thiorhodococcus drewsii AZ1 TaxID=765913 RepID=G2DYL5_9GAMM|nr:STY4526/YPO1902 family pathogenicity island replication protein [Thiorhodococcus drewsii]EGV32642.1 hypothetical protein ThidrDRAFT_1127 [Thiorhodococcus drewsii AZ1]
MNTPCPADVILQFAVEQIHEGHFERVLALGFSWELIRFLESLSGRDLHDLFNVAEHFIALRIDFDQAQSQIAIRRVSEQRRLRQTQQALLRAGAPRQLMIEIYGWTATYYCEQRKFLGLEDDLPKGGRPRTPTSEEEDQILLCWDQYADRPLGERYLETAQAVRVSVRQIRRTIEQRERQADGAASHHPPKQETVRVSRPQARAAR